jgi:L-threonylcarbamoyladenylate synthase
VTAQLAIGHAARILRGGGVIAYPTEGVWGLGCLPLAAPAIERILTIKRRAPAKGFLLIASSVAQLEPFVLMPSGPVAQRIAASWPGPVTWVLPAREAVPWWLTGGRNSVAVRVTAHPTARRLCERVGQALISTSANISGRPPLKQVLVLRRELGGLLDYLLPGQLGGLDGPTEIRDATTGQVVRPAG